MHVKDYSNDHRWRELCQAILDEPDPVKLQELARMLNEELETRETETQKSNRSYVLTAAAPNKSGPEHL
jgi:hypothetical protein